MENELKELKTNEGEKSQEQIRFENTCLNLATGDYRGCPPQSIGNVIHYLRGYGLHQYDIVQIGYRNEIGTVNLYGKPIATFRFVDDIPVFTFDNEHEYQKLNQDNYLNNRNVFENPVARWS
jgi:hypothetical protein